MANVHIDILGADGVRRALDAIAKEQPALFKSALSQEVRNVQKSISATVRNLKISKYQFDPAGKGGKGAWIGKKLPKRDKITRILHGPKGGGKLGNPKLVNVFALSDGRALVGYKGASLERWIVRWQDGGPQAEGRNAATVMMAYRIAKKQGKIQGAQPPKWFASREEQDRFYREFKSNPPPALKPAPPRPFMQDLAEITQRDFCKGLITLIQKKIDGKIAVLQKQRNRKDFGAWERRNAREL